MGMLLSKFPLLQNKQIRLSIVIIAIPVVLLLFYKFAILPASNRIKVLNRLLPKEEEKLKQLVNLTKQYSLLEKRSLAVEYKAGGKETPLSSLDLFKAAGDLGMNLVELSDHPTSQDGAKEKTKELKFEAISLEQLTKYLYDIENRGLAANIKRIVIKKNTQDKSLLDVVLEPF